MKELNIAATVENIEVVTDFVNEELEAFDCPMKAQMQIDIAIDELFDRRQYLVGCSLLRPVQNRTETLHSVKLIIDICCLGYTVGVLEDLVTRL